MPSVPSVYSVAIFLTSAKVSAIPLKPQNSALSEHFQVTKLYESVLTFQALRRRRIEGA